jgi:fructokinase
MKALVLTAEHSLRLEDRPMPVCAAPDQVVLRVVQTGVCGTDRGVLLGKFLAETGVIMGHEAVGEVVQVGSGVTMVQPGSRVIANPTLYCGRCEPCRRGRLNFCLNKTGNELGIDRDGSYAEYLLLEEQFLHPIPDDMSYDRAVLVEPMACVLNNLDAARVGPDDTVTVLGGGPIGVLVGLAADHYGSRVRLLETDPFRRAAVVKFYESVDGCAVEVVDGEGSHPRSDVVVDTVGSLLDRACELAEDLGRVVIMGFDSKASAEIKPLNLVQRGLSLIGAGDYNSLIFPRALALARRLPLEGLITHRFPLDEYGKALDVIGAGQDHRSGYSALKVVIEGRVAA